MSNAWNHRLAAMGMINALGTETAHISERLFAGDQSGIRLYEGYIPQRPCWLAKVPDPLPPLAPEYQAYASRNSQLLLAAYRQIAEATEACLERFGAHRVGVVLGSSTSGISEGEAAFRQLHQDGSLPATYSYSQQQIGTVSEFVAALSGARGISYTISTACSSSAKVFRSAQTLLEANLCDAVIVGGADSLCRLTVNGFAALELVSPAITNPFSAQRSGITIGEGACLFLLLRESGGVQLLGVGESSDAYHMSTPDPSAAGATKAITAALELAGCSPEDVTYLNLHGTGTSHNDSMEARAVSLAFENYRPPCSSTKPLVGHTLGASGAIEIGFCWLALRDLLIRGKTAGFRVPPHCYDGCYDPELPPLPLSSRGDIVFPKDQAICVSTSFGFGGSNCAVVLGCQL